MWVQYLLNDIGRLSLHIEGCRGVAGGILSVSGLGVIGFCWDIDGRMGLGSNVVVNPACKLPHWCIAEFLGADVAVCELLTAMGNTKVSGGKPHLITRFILWSFSSTLVSESLCYLFSPLVSGLPQWLNLLKSFVYCRWVSDGRVPWKEEQLKPKCTLEWGHLNSRVL